MYISQPAVSKNIQELEQELGAQLFNRRGNSIDLTPAGKKLYSHSIEINRLIQNLKYDMGAMNDTLVGNLNIGASSTISQYLIPPVIAQFKENFPNTDLSLISGNTSEINDHLHKGVIDLGITEGDRRLKSFKYTPFLDDEIGFISGIQNPISTGELISVDELKKLPLVIREIGSGTREVFEDAIEEAGIKLSNLNIVISLGSTESIKSFISHAEAVGVFSINGIRPDEKDFFHISRLNENPIKRKFSFITQHGVEHKLSNNFIQFCQRLYNQ